MATLNEIAYDILQHLRANNVDDDDIDLRSIKYWVKNQRALWIKNELSKNKNISESFIQDLGIYILETNNDYKRTVEDLPEFLMINGNPIIVQVIKSNSLTTDISTINYPFICYEGSKFAHNGRFNSSVISSFLYDDKIYLTGSDLSEVSYIKVRGVLSDPTDATGYSDSENYPITDDLLPYLKGEILKLDGSFIIKVQQDPLNDAHNNLN